MQGNVIPELQRTPLEELCLVARVMDPDVNRSMADFLGKAIEPPVPQAITAGVQLLQEIGAMDSNEQLTTLGRHLARLPLPPTLGKLILYGLLFHCLNPIITVACALGYRCVATFASFIFCSWYTFLGKARFCSCVGNTCAARSTATCQPQSHCLHPLAS